MTNEKKKWIDNASYEQLLMKWRFESIANSHFANEDGLYYSKIMNKRKNELSSGEQVEVSNRVGWE